MSRFLIASSVTLLASSAAIGACVTCATELRVTKMQLVCLEKRLEGYLRGDTDPAMVSLLSCDGDRVPTGSLAQGHAAPILNPIIDDKGDADAANKLLFLTKDQLNCLRGNMERLKQSDGQPIVFRFSDCK